MTTKLFFKDQIRSEVLKVLSGYCFRERQEHFPQICILSPWISDVQLEIGKDTYDLDTFYFGWDYGIFSINLPYALLALKLDYGANIDIVTLPPTEKHYDNRASSIKTLLDFLDEIGCNVFVNPDLHTKLIHSNDLALLGSFNLSFSALWGREEIGASFDDMENLKVLEKYARKVVASSKPYGYTVQAREQDLARTEELSRYFDKHRRLDLEPKPFNSVTRGWLYEDVLGVTRDSHEFIYSFFGPILVDEVIKLATFDMEEFYLKLVLAYVINEPKSKVLYYLKNRFGYQGKYEINEILNFLETKLAREHIPKIKPSIEFFPWKSKTSVRDKPMDSWSLEEQKEFQEFLKKLK